MNTASLQEAKYKTQFLIGKLTDTIEVSKAKLGAKFEASVVKATSQDEVIPKEKHVRTLIEICKCGAQDGAMLNVIVGLSKRLKDNDKSWLVTLKALIVFHRLLRDVGPSFHEELLRRSDETHDRRMLRLLSFADHTTTDTWDMTAWIRVYSAYLDERLAVFRSVRFHPELATTTISQILNWKGLSNDNLMQKVSELQCLLDHLLKCVPQGAAQNHVVPMHACILVLKEVRCVYKVVCEGVLNLVDRIFEMDRGDALKGCDRARAILTLNERLEGFKAAISDIPLLQDSLADIPTVQLLPPDSMSKLEELVKGPTKATIITTAGTGPSVSISSAIPRVSSAPTCNASSVDLLGDLLDVSPSPLTPVQSDPTSNGSYSTPITAPATIIFDPFAAAPQPFQQSSATALPLPTQQPSSTDPLDSLWGPTVGTTSLAPIIPAFGTLSSPSHASVTPIPSSLAYLPPPFQASVSLFAQPSLEAPAFSVFEAEAGLTALSLGSSVALSDSIATPVPTMAATTATSAAMGVSTPTLWGPTTTLPPTSMPVSTATPTLVVPAVGRAPASGSTPPVRMASLEWGPSAIFTSPPPPPLSPPPMQRQSSLGPAANPFGSPHASLSGVSPLLLDLPGSGSGLWVCGGLSSSNPFSPTSSVPSPSAVTLTVGENDGLAGTSAFGALSSEPPGNNSHLDAAFGMLSPSYNSGARQSFTPSSSAATKPGAGGGTSGSSMLTDLSADLFGKPQTPAMLQPMRPKIETVSQGEASMRLL